jgi:hypothetical protein
VPAPVALDLAGAHLPARPAPRAAH